MSLIITFFVYFIFNFKIQINNNHTYFHSPVKTTTIASIFFNIHLNTYNYYYVKTHKKINYTTLVLKKLQIKTTRRYFTPPVAWTQVIVEKFEPSHIAWKIGSQILNIYISIYYMTYQFHT